MQLMLDKHKEIKSLAETVRKLEKDPRIKKMVDDRIDDFIIQSFPNHNAKIVSPVFVHKQLC